MNGRLKSTMSSESSKNTACCGNEMWSHLVEEADLVLL